MLVRDFEGPAAILLKDLGPFEDHAEDLHVLHQLARESVDTFVVSTDTTVFELGVLGTVVRNAALVITHFDGEPDFSRWAPLKLLDHPVVPLPLDGTVYAALSRARKAGEGVLGPPG